MIGPNDVKVVMIQPISRPGPDGKDLRLYSIQFTVRERITDTIEIPRAEYTKELAMQRVLALANEHIGLLDM